MPCPFTRRRALLLALFLGSSPALQATESNPVSPVEALELFAVDEGFAVELVAAEPLTRDPVAIDWGFDGKLWVAEMADYPYGIDGEGKPGGRVRYLTDEDGDGRMDTSTLFLDGLSFPTSVMAWRSGVLVAAAPEILYAEDTDGDGRADRREVLFSGFMEGNQQLRVNGLRWGLDGWVYGASGGHHAGFGADNRIRMGTGSDAPEVALGSGDFRFLPGGSNRTLERVAGPSQFGRVRDDWGNWFGVQNSYPLWHYVLEEKDLRRNPEIPMPDVRQQLRGQQPRVFGNKPSQKRFHGFDHVGRYTSACGPSIYRDERLYPVEEDLTHAFTCEPFSNLVQHHHLRRSGVTFEGARAPSPGPTDFLASADRWCRPVMTRTGPDGALWVVDMYRYMIEHPDWLPLDGREELKPFYRHGEDQGRIYRVVRKNQTRRAIPELAGQSQEVLMEHLGDANGLVRDAAQRMLLDGARDGLDPQLVSSLRALAAKHRSAKTRLQALGTLLAAGCDVSEVSSEALRDPAPEVRRFAVRHAEAVRVIGLAQDPDAAVRLQVAIKLGDVASAEAGRALLDLAKRPEHDGFTEAAILSSVPLHHARFAAAADALRHREGLIRGLLTMAKTRPEERAILLERLFGRAEPDDSDYRLAAHWFEVAGSAESTTRDWSSFLSRARTEAANQDAAESLRLAALGVLGRDRRVWEQEAAILRNCLNPREPADIQLAAVEALGRSRQETVPDLVFERWPSLTPGVRSAALDGLMAHVPWRNAILAALRAGVLNSQDLSTAQQQFLLEREPEAAVWLTAPQKREEALKAHAGSLELEGDAERGRAVFTERCASCHQAGDLGKVVGPDLRGLTNRSPEALYAAILDPNRAVDPRYAAFTATTRTGEVLHGLLARETGTTLTFIQLDGSERAVLRAEVDTLSGSSQSLMPEGLEAGLSDQALADLIAFVQTIH